MNEGETNVRYREIKIMFEHLENNIRDIKEDLRDLKKQLKDHDKKFTTYETLIKIGFPFFILLQSSSFIFHALSFKKFFFI